MVVIITTFITIIQIIIIPHYRLRHCHHHQHAQHNYCRYHCHYCYLIPLLSREFRLSKHLLDILVSNINSPYTRSHATS